MGNLRMIIINTCKNMNQQESKKYLDKSPSVFSMYIDKNLKSYIIPYINGFNILKVKKNTVKFMLK